MHRSLVPALALLTFQCFVQTLAWSADPPADPPSTPAAQPSTPATPPSTPATPAEEPKPPAPGVVATVNGEPVTREQLVDFMLKQYGSQVLDQMVAKMVVEQAAKKQNITVSDQELEAEYTRFKASLPTPQVFDSYEKQVGKAFVLDSLRPNVIRRKLGEMLVTVDPSEMDQVRASHILITVSNSGDEAARAKAADEALKKANDILAEVKKPGADFAALAKQYSQDTGSAQRGGDLDYFSRGRMVKPFEDAAFAANPGDIIGPIKSDFGYHIIKVVDKKEGSKLPPDQFEQQKAQVIQRKANAAVAQWLEKQRKEAVIQKFPTELSR